MPRIARAVQAGTVFHVLNRGNGRQRLFCKDFVLSAWRVDRPHRWTAAVNEPLGEEPWERSTARRLGLEFTLRGPGPPRKIGQNQ